MAMFKNRAIIVALALFTACSGKESVQFMAPAFLKADVSVKGAEATFVCELSGNRVEQCGIVLEDRLIEGKMEGQAFTVTAGGLETGRTYTWSAFAKAGGSEITTPVQEFTAPDGNVPIPDPAFKTYLTEHYDWNHDGELSPQEAGLIRRIDFHSNQLGVKTLRGIEFMPNLEEIWCWGNWCDDYNLEKFPFYYLSKRYHFDDCFGPVGTLESLDVSNNPKLRILIVLHNSALGDLQGSLNLSNNPHLEEVDLGMTSLSVPDFSACESSLVRLKIAHLWGSFPDFSRMPRLKELEISYVLSGRGVPIDISQCPLLEELNVAGAASELSDLRFNPELKVLDISYCDFSEIDISRLPHLRSFKARMSSLKCLDVSANTELQELLLSPMHYDALETLYIAPGQVIPGVTVDRSEAFIPAYTQIVEKSVE